MGTPLRMRATLIASAALLAALAGTAPAWSARDATLVPASQESLDSLAQSLVDARIASGRNPSIVVGILDDGARTILTGGRASAPNDRLDGQTVFEIGSITKVFTGVLLAHMTREGEVQLLTPVGTLLPAGTRVPARGGREITLVDLATHTSGLPRMPNNFSPADQRNPYADYDEAALYEFLRDYRLLREAGGAFQYSNIGAGLLGHALARRAGGSYESVLTERILGPLGMRDTRVALDAEFAKRLAVGHDAVGRKVPHWEIPTLAGAGALLSTADDLLTFAAAHLDASVPLYPVLREAMKPRRALGDDRPDSIGLHWLHATVGDSVARSRIAWHNGGTGGYRSFLGIDLVKRRAVVVLTNSANGADDIGRRLLAVP